MCSKGGSVWHLKEVVLQYSATGYSSQGLRFYFRHLLHRWKDRNPQWTAVGGSTTTHFKKRIMLKPCHYEFLTELDELRFMSGKLRVIVRTVENKYESPKATFRYTSPNEFTASGWRDGGVDSQCEVSMKDVSPSQIEQILDLHRDSKGHNRFLKHGGPRTWTERRSIQGLWRPSLPSQLLALRWFHRRRPTMRLPKYSPLSLSLSIQAIRGQGRWGSELEFPKGWDQMHLRDILGNPLLCEFVECSMGKKRPFTKIIAQEERFNHDTNSKKETAG